MDLGEVNRGRSRHRPRHEPRLYGGPYPFIQTGDIKASRGRITSYSQTYSEEGLAQSRLWPAGTMCITIAANIAETALLTFPACFPDSVIGFIGDETKCDVRFVEYMFRRLRRHIQHEMRDSGTVQDNINLAYLEHLWFPVPDLNLQREIAETLSAIDDKIHVNSELNRALESLGAALFTSWFVDFDPVIAKRDGRTPVGVPAEAIDLFPTHFEESELGAIPQGWRTIPLDSVADFLNGLALQRYPPRDGDVLPVIKIAELRAETSVGADLCGGVPSEYVIDDGDVIFSWSGSLMVDVWCGGMGALNQHLFKVTSREVPKWFYLGWLNEHLPEFQAIAADKATTMGHIRRFHLTEAKVLRPPEPLMDAMTSVQQPLLEKVIHNRLESRALAELRDTLLRPLLSGELTINGAEKAVGEAI
ncbi:MAG: restriction endonuclease subunit S [Spirochaetes bacterium]|nr:restriction endonuclease subunit S [Spirochaetota bacterium]